MMKHLALITCAVCSLAMLTGCPPAKPGSQQPETSVMHKAAVVPGSSVSLPLEIAPDDNALLNLDLSDTRLWALARCISLPLVQSQGDGSLTPGLAKEWTSTDNGATWLFTLNPAPDHEDEADYLGGLLITHFKAILHGEETPLRAQLIDLVEGAAAYQQGSSADISGIQLDGDTLAIKLTRPDNYFAAWISQPGLGVLENWELEHAAGYGPWRIKRFTPTAEEEAPAQLVLEPNPASLVGKSVAGEITYILEPDRSKQVELFTSGQLHAANVQWDEAPAIEDASATVNAFRRLETAVPVVGQFDLHEFPWGESKFQSKRGLRQAVNLVLDQDYLATSVNNQITAWPYFFPKTYSELVPPQLLQNPTYSLGQDIPAAQNGLTAADHMDGCHLIPGMDLGYLGNDDTSAEVVKVLEYWNEISVKMRPLVMSPDELRLRLEHGTHEIVYRRLYPAYPSPDALAYPYLYGALLGNGGNYWNQAQPAVDQFIRDAQAASTSPDETRIFRELAQYLNDDALLVFVGYYTPAVLISENLGGYSLSPFDFSASLPMNDFTKLGLVK